MSDRELATQLINDVPDYKVGYLLAYIQGLIADENDDDEYCEKLYQNYLNDPDPEKGETIPFEEFVKMCEVDINAIQNWNW